jgi:hypothetical protein
MVYAAVYINALIQRNPPAVRNNPALAGELEQGLDFAITQLQEDHRLAEESRNRSISASSGGAAGVQSRLTTRPPVINWGQYK